MAIGKWQVAICYSLFAIRYLLSAIRHLPKVNFMSTTPIEVFFSYAHADEALRDELAKHLKLLQRQGIIAL
jgi:hypothetical protein